jgi:hypothetical protein
MEIRFTFFLPRFDYLFIRRNCGGGGILVSLKGPQEVMKGDPALALMGRSKARVRAGDETQAEEGAEGSNALAMSREVVFCLNIPRTTLFPFPEPTDFFENEEQEPENGIAEGVSAARLARKSAMEHLCIIPGDLLQGLGTYTAPPPLEKVLEAKRAKRAKKLEESTVSMNLKQLEHAAKETPLTILDLEVTPGGDLVSSDAGIGTTAAAANGDSEWSEDGEDSEELMRLKPPVLSLPSSAVVRAYQVGWYM